MQAKSYKSWKLSIGERLKQERLRLDKTREEVAFELGFNENNIKNYEREYPEILYVYKFSQTYHVDLHYLIGEEPPE